MIHKPKISICVSVDDVELHLPHFLDSAINQNFDDYELILVDNQSTDNSSKILKKYEENFPDRVFVSRTSKRSGLGAVRNLAFQKSQGDYIFWCDADGLLHPETLMRLYEKAVQNDADITCGYGIHLDERDGEIVRVSRLHEKHTSADNEDIISTDGEIWLCLIKRNLIERIGPMPDDLMYGDKQYLTVLQSHAENIQVLNFPVYYQFERKNSPVDITVSEEECLAAIESWKYALGECNPENFDAVQRYVAGQLVWSFDNCWPFLDLFVHEIKADSAWFYEKELFKKNRRMFDRLRWADSLADIQFPNIVYVDGFDSAPTDERLEELREKVFHDGCEIVILSEKTCDVEENTYVKRAYDRGDMTFVSRYFALKRIYENGGIFIHEKIRLLNYFSYLKYQNAFFALIDKTTYSDRVFGASAGNEAIGTILKTYSDAWDKRGEFFPLSERISIILTAKYGVHQDGRGRLFHETVSVLPPNHSVVDTRFGSATRMCAFEHDFSDYANDPAYITLPRSSLEVLMAPPDNRPARSSREIVLERELADMKKTNTYKLMMKIRQIGDGPMGPFLKKIFHSLLKLRKKFKRT